MARIAKDEEKQLRIAVLGTGIVGRTLAEGFVRTGHGVTMGTRSVQDTTIRRWEGSTGSMAEWLADNPRVALADFASVAADAEIVVNATSGSTSIAAIGAAGSDNLAGKVLIDVANPLDFRRGFPPTLSTKDSDSLGEAVQRAFPQCGSPSGCARWVHWATGCSTCGSCDPDARPDDAQAVHLTCTVARRLTHPAETARLECAARPARGGWRGTSWCVLRFRDRGISKAVRNGWRSGPRSGDPLRARAARNR